MLRVKFEKTNSKFNPLHSITYSAEVWCTVLSAHYEVLCEDWSLAETWFVVANTAAYTLVNQLVVYGFSELVQQVCRPYRESKILIIAPDRHIKMQNNAALTYFTDMCLACWGWLMNLIPVIHIIISMILNRTLKYSIWGINFLIKTRITFLSLWQLSSVSSDLIARVPVKEVK